MNANETTAPAAKPGVTTTEFWISLIAVAAGPVMTYLEKVEGPWGIVASAVAAAIYAALRTSTKTQLLNSSK